MRALRRELRSLGSSFAAGTTVAPSAIRAASSSPCFWERPEAARQQFPRGPSHVGVRDVLRAALREAASASILVHNHPSGDPAPSDEDVAFTRAVAVGATVVGTPLVDHVILARQRSSSLFDHGLMTSD